MTKKISGIFFDWAGTTIDQGSCGPIEAFIEIFNSKGIKITGDQVRGPMGMHKKTHIRKLTEIPEIQDQWASNFENLPTEENIDELFRMFEPCLERSLLKHSKVICGVNEVIKKIKNRGIKVGSSTGYSKSQMKIIVPEAHKQGYEPDSIICASDVPMGRPSPWMIFEGAKQMNIYPPETWIKVDDTIVGIEEGKNAGAWTIGVTRTGNLVGLSDTEISKIQPENLKERICNATALFLDAKTNYVIESVENIINVLDEIERRIMSGEKP